MTYLTIEINTVDSSKFSFQEDIFTKQNYEDFYFEECSEVIFLDCEKMFEALSDDIKGGQIGKKTQNHLELRS